MLAREAEAAVDALRASPAKLAGRTRRQMDINLAVETSMQGQVRGLARAIGGDPALGRTGWAVKAAVRATAF